MLYLSDEWFAAANAALQANAGSAPDEPLVIDQHVAAAASYRVRIERDGCSIIEIDPSASGADATFRQSAETAAAVAQGTTDAHQAFLLGHITFEGDVDVLIARRDSLKWLETALAPVLADTEFT